MVGLGWNLGNRDDLWEVVFQVHSQGKAAADLGICTLVDRAEFLADLGTLSEHPS